MDNLQYYYNIRCGKNINILEFVKDLEDEYRRKLKASIDSFDTEDEVSSETFNDYEICKEQFNLLKELGYIEPEELSAIETILFDIRLEELGNVPESAND